MSYNFPTFQTLSKRWNNLVKNNNITKRFNPAGFTFISIWGQSLSGKIKSIFIWIQKNLDNIHPRTSDSDSIEKHAVGLGLSRLPAQYSQGVVLAQSWQSNENEQGSFIFNVKYDFSSSPKTLTLNGNVGDYVKINGIQYANIDTTSFQQIQTIIGNGTEFEQVDDGKYILYPSPNWARNMIIGTTTPTEVGTDNLVELVTDAYGILISEVEFTLPIDSSLGLTIIPIEESNNYVPIFTMKLFSDATMGNASINATDNNVVDVVLSIGAVLLTNQLSLSSKATLLGSNNQTTGELVTEGSTPITPYINQVIYQLNNGDDKVTFWDSIIYTTNSPVVSSNPEIVGGRDEETDGELKQRVYQKQSSTIGYGLNEAEIQNTYWDKGFIFEYDIPDQPETAGVLIIYVINPDNSLVSITVKQQFKVALVLNNKPPYVPVQNIQIVDAELNTVDIIINSLQPEDTNLYSSVTESFKNFFNDDVRIGEGITYANLISVITNTTDENGIPPSPFTLATPSTDLIAIEGEKYILGDVTINGLIQ